MKVVVSLLLVVIIASSASINIFAQEARASQSRPRKVTSSQSRPTAKVLDSRTLQAAINSAKCGETIVLQAGTTYVAPQAQSFTLPYKPQCPVAESSFITITTSDLTNLPGTGTRVSPQNTPAMATIVTASSMPAIYINFKAHHYRF